MKKIADRIYIGVAFMILMAVLYLAANYYFQDCQTLKTKFGYMEAPARCIQ
jgi:hypothetical protein